jgi:hypothetical protein
MSNEQDSEKLRQELEIYTCKKWRLINIILGITSIVLSYKILNKVNNIIVIVKNNIYPSDRIEWNGIVIVKNNIYPSDRIEWNGTVLI